MKNTWPSPTTTSQLECHSQLPTREQF